VEAFMAQAGHFSWGQECLRRYWHFGGYIARAPQERWAVRMLSWSPLAACRRGHPRAQWPDALTRFARYLRLHDWKLAAANHSEWNSLADRFVSFYLF
jgi:hypothetical protein